MSSPENTEKKLRFEQKPEDLRPDYTCDHTWEAYSTEDHAIWAELYARQSKMLVGRACNEYMQSLGALKITHDKIPDFRRMSEILEKTTGWQIVTVPGLIPSEVFHTHLSERRFPITFWIRDRAQIDYIVEPDVFHDLFGHIPMLMNPTFADYVQEFGKGGVKAANLHSHRFLERLYWYTVEFGLINTPDGIRIYGSGIVSSKTESIYCLEDQRPHRIGFDLKRVMLTEYRYDKLQECYFVIDSLEQLMEVTRQDFTPIYEELRNKPHIEPYKVGSGDKLFHRGTVEHEKHDKPE